MYHRSDRSVRESFTCIVCFSICRYRALASGVLRAVEQLSGVQASALAELRCQEGTSISVLDTQIPFSLPPHQGYEAPRYLGDTPWIRLQTTEFLADQPWGVSLESGATNQTLEALTFDDATFDVVITSDVMEHVRLYDRAHAEIARVLKPGGIYIFTVPHGRGQYEHTIRVQVHDADDPSKDEHLLPPEYHGEGILSYRAFGRLIDDELAAVGIDVQYFMDTLPFEGLFDAEVFVGRKRQ
jgi:SAM-dependent methyltransferase